MLLKSVERLKAEISKMSSGSRRCAVHQSANVNRVTRVGTYPRLEPERGGHSMV